MSRIKPKRSNVAAKVPTTSDLEVGEIAVNMADRKIFVHEPGGTVVDLTEQPDLTGYATEAYVTAQGYLTAHQDISGKADTTYVDAQLGLKADQATTYTKTEVDNAIAASAPTGYNNTNWDTAFGWGDHAAAGYLTTHQDISGKADTTYVDAQVALKADAADNATQTWVAAQNYLTTHQDISGKADTTYVDAQVALKADALDNATQTWVTAQNYLTSETPETVTSLGLAANILKYTDENGVETDLDLSLYLDDTNLARIVSGTLDNITNIATFTRDDASTFTIDLSNLAQDLSPYSTTAQMNTAISTATANSANWDTAFGWGDHGLVGYLTTHQDISGKADTTYVDTQLGLKADAADNATQSWVTSQGYLTSETPETVTSLSLAANILTYTDEDGVETDLDLSLYLDDTNLARIVSGSLDNATSIATFTRDDASTFTIDLSNLAQDLTPYSTTAEMNTAIGTATTDMATQTWVTAQGYLTTHQDISGKLDIDIADFEQTVSSLGTLTTDTALSNVAGKVVNITIGADFAITGHDLTTGQSTTLIVTQDPTGTRLLTWPTGTKFAGGNADLSTDPDAVDIVGVFYDGTTLYVSISKGYATV